MKLVANEISLVLKDSPGCLWLLGLFFITICGMLLYGSLGGFSNYREIPQWQLLVATLMSLCGIGAGFWVIISHPHFTTRLHRPTQKIEISLCGLSGKKSQVYDFGEVLEFQVLALKDDEGGDIFEVIMLLTNGQTLPLTHSYNRIRTDCEAAAAQLNHFLRPN